MLPLNQMSPWTVSSLGKSIDIPVPFCMNSAVESESSYAMMVVSSGSEKLGQTS
jgi:hypothetical protein